ncbi:MAG TPA: sigma-54 dependent transcriptional regulator [Candidatus Polarisedimenticolaceae bacterium]
MPPILLVEDRDSLRAVLRQTLEAEGYEVEEAADGKRAVAALGASRYLAVVTDLKLPGADGHAVLAAAREADPDLPVVVMTAYGTVEDAVGAMKQGAFDFLSKPVDPDHLVLLLRRAVERRHLLDENLLLKKEFAERLGFPSIIGESSALVEVIRRIRKAAPADATVLLEGESGTGKELFARAIHHLSPRKDAPFVAINCAAIPETLLESELFGHEKGAFTGASSARAGRFELADRGTLFLDEIGELGAGVQAKLLRVLQERKFERVGGNRTIAVNVRIVAATNRDLKAEVGARRFRDDLYFRLAVVTVTIPPLRDRRSDVALLARHFLEKYRREIGRDRLEFSPEALEALRAHRWPGNVRELENLVERVAILAEGDRLEPGHLGLEGVAATPTDLAAFARVVGLDGGLDAVSTRARDLAERLMVERALAETGGNKTRAAQMLDVNYKRLLVRIRELGLESEREEEPSKETP